MMNKRKPGATVIFYFLLEIAPLTVFPKYSRSRPFSTYLYLRDLYSGCSKY